VRIQVLTQEDAFYIPRILDLLLEKRRDVVGVAIVPGELQAGRALRFLRMMGARDFALQVVNLAWYRALDLLVARAATVHEPLGRVRGPPRRRSDRARAERERARVRRRAPRARRGHCWSRSPARRSSSASCSPCR
jgi:hypothetical protein